MWFAPKIPVAGTISPPKLFMSLSHYFVSSSITRLSQTRNLTSTNTPAFINRSVDINSIIQMQSRYVQAVHPMLISTPRCLKACTASLIFACNGDLWRTAVLGEVGSSTLKSLILSKQCHISRLLGLCHSYRKGGQILTEPHRLTHTFSSKDSIGVCPDLQSE